MKRVLKFLAAASALVFLAAVAAIVWLTVFFDADVYRDEIEEAVRRHTGREIDIEGPLAVKVFPRIAVEAGRMTFAARDGFGPDPMLEMEGAAVFLQARPLLRGKIEIDRIRFDSPRVRLAVNDVGERAWGDLAARLQHAAGGGAPIGDEQFLGVGLAALAVQGLVVDDGELQWSDAFRGTHFIAADIDLEMERLRHREAGGLSLKARIVDEARGASLDIAVTAMVRADFETLDTDITMLEVEIAGSAFHVRATAKSVDLRGLRVAPELIAGDVVVATSRGDTSVELSAPLLRYRRSGNTLAADVLKLAGPGLEAAGRVAIHDPSGIPSMAITLETRQVDLGALTDALGLTERIAGTGSATLALEATGSDAVSMRRSLSGEVSFDMRDGVVRGVDVGRVLEAARDAISGTQPAAPPSAPRTRFERMTGSLDFVDGIGAGDDFYLQSDAFNVTGEGKVDLPRAHIDYRLLFHVVDEGLPGAATPSAGFESVSIPLRVVGPFARPAVVVDMPALLREAVRLRMNDADVD